MTFFLTAHLIWTLRHVPFMSILTGFHGTQLLFLEFKGVFCYVKVGFCKMALTISS